MRKKIHNIMLFAKAFSFLGESKNKYLLGALLGSTEMLLLFAAPYINQRIINIIIGEEDGNIYVMISRMLLLFVLLTPLVIVGRFLQSTAAASGTICLQKTIFDHIVKLPYEVATKYKSGDFLLRLTDDIRKTTGVFASFAVSNLIQFVTIFSISFVILVFREWRIAILGVAYGLLNLAFAMYLNPKTKRLEHESKLKMSSTSSFIVEALRGMPVVRIFSLYKPLQERYHEVSSEIKNRRVRFRVLSGITYGVADFFAQSAQAVGLVVGILLLYKSRGLGEIVYIATVVGIIGGSIHRLSTFLLLCQPNLVSIERVLEILNLPEETSINQLDYINNQHPIAIRFRNVNFAYGGEKPVLRDLNFEIRKGQNVAIVGKSGSGKSTILKLLERIYKPQNGEIEYFGVTGGLLSDANIRELFAYVPQDCALFEGSIRENIVFGKLNASMNEIEEAAKRSAVNDFIENLPEKYDTAVGERGSRLSGGQRQRIAIARALIKGAPIVLLDEATSALDSANEKRVLDELSMLGDEITIISVAHRLSTIRNADRVLVIDDGEIVEDGSFAELIEKGGLFAAMYLAQNEKIWQ